MTYDDGRSSNFPAVLIAVVVGLLILIGLVVLGAGAFFVVRMQAMARAEHQRALMAEEKAQQTQARLQMERARATREEAISQQQGAAQPESPQPGRRTIVISLDEDGNVSADGESLALERLKTWLENHVESDGTPAVAIQADNRCLFEHVASVLSVCKELGISDLDITSSVSAAGNEASRVDDDTDPLTP